jgi:hypothetical protein
VKRVLLACALFFEALGTDLVISAEASGANAQSTVYLERLPCELSVSKALGGIMRAPC